MLLMIVYYGSELDVLPLVFIDVWQSVYPHCAVRIVLCPNMQQKAWAEEDQMTTNTVTSWRGERVLVPRCINSPIDLSLIQSLALYIYIFRASYLLVDCLQFLWEQLVTKTGTGERSIKQSVKSQWKITSDIQKRTVILKSRRTS